MIVMLLMAFICTKGNNAIIGSVICFLQADSNYTESSSGKEEKQEAAFGSIFKVKLIP